ncbi:MAG: LPS assembly lipoprotein LptE [Isosphaeraceae bacterium]|nr:LPS assembly lipoprotein LptE [Isosphaeraceae bacterium]
MDGPISRRRLLSAASVASALAATALGCGYTLRPPFNDSIRTVYVPVFRSVSFRRDVNLKLTEAVQKEIRTRTPFKVVGSPDGADSILEGSVDFADKNLVVENPYNLPRQLTATLTVSVTWTDTKAGRKVTEPVVVSEIVNFIPEVGEGSEAAFQKACERLARQIVGMMEQQW